MRERGLRAILDNLAKSHGMAKQVSEAAKQMGYPVIACQDSPSIANG
ncbi:MAG: hypothetical protein KKD63_03475 [Proteobacteria bacterium]|nr:hypothetical protein [Pseudomonadota bacterium]